MDFLSITLFEKNPISWKYYDNILMIVSDACTVNVLIALDLIMIVCDAPSCGISFDYNMFIILAIEGTCCQNIFTVIIQLLNPRNPQWRGRLCTVELLVPTSLDQCFSYCKHYLLFYTTSYPYEEVNCTESFPSVSVPAEPLATKLQLTLPKWLNPNETVHFEQF